MTPQNHRPVVAGASLNAPNQSNPIRRKPVKMYRNEVIRPKKPRTAMRMGGFFILWLLPPSVWRPGPTLIDR